MTKKGVGENAVEPRDTGRPTKYRAHFCNTVLQDETVKAEGATDVSIAAALGVDRASVIRWRAEHEDFAAACQSAKEVANDLVEASMFQRARGYAHAAVKIFMPQGAAEPVYAPYTERFPPDTGAGKNWLENRRPDKWRSRVEHTGADGGPLEISWQMPSPAAPGATPVIEGDQARDITPQQPTALQEASLPGGEPIGVAWGDAASAKDSAKSAGPVTPTRPTRGDKP